MFQLPPLSMSRTPMNITRRECFGAALGVAIGSASRSLRAAVPARPPVLYVSHGAPIFAVNDPARIAELRAWGARLPKPRGILAMTPHYGTRRLEVGATGRGFAMYDLPEGIKRRVPPGLTYDTPPSEALAARLDALLGGGAPLPRGDRLGFDHTTWMPLKCLIPDADVPVIELAYPYVREADAFAIGRKLAPLRDEGILFVASGGMTHNLAAMDLGAEPPAWTREFDAWASERIAARDADGLIDWRAKAPAVNLAHPDDGGHYRVLLVALGVALAGGDARVSFPVTGFEATMSKRSAELA
jgi:4,5-DOPA dioxygenase extradiol